ncbi:MAG TPA: 3-methyl-2-oxobutanoate hydroxymethyltransferase [Steroidobacteraceae bacterium]|nr:3-methyl-2-oxobutanoate hydroxymethyltransferase [Steroidobacteraceae bacterium]
MDRIRKTVADLQKTRGMRQLTMLHVKSLEEAAAAEAAGIDLLSIIDPLWSPAMRAAAPTCFVIVGLLYGQLATGDEYLRAAHHALNRGGDAVYCAASLETIARLRAEGIPVCGHAGLIPSKRTWTGGFRAVGTTHSTAMLVYRQVRDLERAGAFAAEIEVVPDRVASEISRRTSLLLLSMGAGRGCDAQYLFAEDVLGFTEGHRPRHAKVYRDFRSEFARLQRERIAAFREFSDDVRAGAYPAAEHVVGIADAEFEAFLAEVDVQN